METVADVAERYERFARDEVGDRSPLYAEWAAGIARDPAVQAVLAQIPATRRQPPLVFAVARMLGAPLEAYPALAAWILDNTHALVDETARRALQTNEPLRCAALLPALASIGGPIALLELGASAGLCLIPDLYSYRYRTADGDRAVDPVDGVSSVVLECEARGPVVPPLELPSVVWRAGIDLAPLDPRDSGDVAFLRGLVWPGEQGRAERIDAALSTAAAASPRVVAGDAADGELVRDLVDSAPEGATVVVTTPGLMPHVARAGRDRIAETLRSLPVEWVSIEPAGLRGFDAPGFVVTRGDAVLATCDPLGGWLEWRPGIQTHAG